MYSSLHLEQWESVGEPCGILKANSILKARIGRFVDPVHATRFTTNYPWNRGLYSLYISYSHCVDIDLFFIFIFFYVQQIVRYLWSSIRNSISAAIALISPILNIFFYVKQKSNEFLIQLMDTYSELYRFH